MPLLDFIPRRESPHRQLDVPVARVISVSWSGFFATFAEALPRLRVCLKSEDFIQC